MRTRDIDVVVVALHRICVDGGLMSLELGILVAGGLMSLELVISPWRALREITMDASMVQS